MASSSLQPTRLSLYSARQVRELDRIAIDEYGVPGLTLMKRAGQAVFDLLNDKWPGRPLTIFCGSGNNAGDGYVVATLARQQYLTVRVIQVGEQGKLCGDAETAYGEAIESGVEVIPFSESLFNKGTSNEKDLFCEGVIVDALLGTGLSGAVRDPFDRAIRLINNSGWPVVAVDIPSGLCADSGVELGVAVRAEATVSFIGLKKGLFTGLGPTCAGDVFYDDLDVPDDIYKHLQSDIRLTSLSDTLQDLVPRQRHANKGDFGHVLVIGGDLGMGGAVAMAAEAALRVGAGLVSVATRPEHVTAILTRRPELMVHGVISGQELEPLLSKPSVLVVGPGLGQSAWSQQLLQQVLKSVQPLILDADGLNQIAGDQTGNMLQKLAGRAVVMTPHPGEAGRLLNCSTADVQRGRYHAALAISEKFKSVVVLKGAGSLVADAGSIEVSCLGNPGMASGGMGDVLSGVIGGLMAQGLSVYDSAILGVNLHGAAGDEAADERGERGLLATDIINKLQKLVNLS